MFILVYPPQHTFFFVVGVLGCCDVLLVGVHDISHDKFGHVKLLIMTVTVYVVILKVQSVSVCIFVFSYVCLCSQLLVEVFV